MARYTSGYHAIIIDMGGVGAGTNWTPAALPVAKYRPSGMVGLVASRVGGHMVCFEREG
jgi:hypothetical protein